MPYNNYGKGVYGTIYNAGAPGAGSNEVQTLTLAGSWAGGDSFRVSLDGRLSVAVPWSAVNATLLASLQTALDGISGAANNVVATAGTLTAGIGTILLTFSGGDLARRNVSTIAVVNVTSAGGGTAVNAETTPGVTATARDCQPGTQLLDTSANKLYINTGSLGAPVWTVVGTQS